MARQQSWPDSNGPDNKPEDSNETSKCCQAQVQTCLRSTCGVQANHLFLHAFEIFLQLYPWNTCASQKEPRKIFGGVLCWTQKTGLSLRHLILQLRSLPLLLTAFQVKGRRSTCFGKQCWHSCTELKNHHTLSSQCCLTVGMPSFTHSVNTSVSPVLPVHRGIDLRGRCHIFARDFTSLCHHAPVEAK